MCEGGHSCMCVRVGVHVCVLGWEFLYVLGLALMCVLGWASMCVRVGIHVCVIGWAFMYLC